MKDNNSMRNVTVTDGITSVNIGGKYVTVPYKIVTCPANWIITARPPAAKGKKKGAKKK